MRIFLAGATGVIGVRLVPLLVAAGHIVAGMTRSQPHVVDALGAEPVVCNVYDQAALGRAMERFAPDLVLHQLTDLPDNLAHLDTARSANQRIRTQGTLNLLAAASTAKTVAQSTAFPAATQEHERLVLDTGGVILRYGRLYGPGTWYSDGQLPPPPRIHIDRSAERTAAALDAPPRTILELVDPMPGDQR
jgi:uncharacterized protein YbjT (DUF2867 family)